MRRCSEQTKQEVINLYEEGFTCIYLSKKFSMSSNTIWKYVREAGGKVRDNKETHRVRVKVGILQREDLSVKEIAKVMKFKPAAVEEWLRSYWKTHKYCDMFFFEEINTEEKAYWLGFILADGWVSYEEDKRYSLGINLRESDKTHLEKFSRSIQSTYTISRRKKDGSYSTSLSCRKLVLDLIKLGVVPNKSLIAKPIKVRDDLQRHFWRGVLDGDGWINSNLKGMGICGTESVCKGLQEFLEENNFELHFHYINKKTLTQLKFTHSKSMEKILDFLYEGSSVFLDRKYRLYLKLKNKDFNHYHHLEVIKEKAVELYTGGLNARQVMKVLGLKHPNYVTRWIEELNEIVYNRSFSSWLMWNTINCVR